jgi:F-actin capping protein, beta subunit
MDNVDGRYYEGGVSSVYMWDLDDGIAGVVLFKKSILPQDPSSRDPSSRDLLPESFKRLD